MRLTGESEIKRANCFGDKDTIMNRLLIFMWVPGGRFKISVNAQMYRLQIVGQSLLT